MDGNKPTRDGAGQIDRRTILKLTGGAAASTVAASGVVAARGHGNGKGNGNGNGGGNGKGGGKQGGRGHTSSPVLPGEPFTLSNPRHKRTNASCMSSRSAQQDYTKYDLDYCDRDGDEEYTVCIIPDQSRVNEETVYEFRSKQECKSDNQEFQHKFSFGPSNSRDDC